MEEMRIDHNNPESINEVVVYIIDIMQRCMVMGANDSERSTFDNLLTRVKNGSLDPKEAKKQAASILANKQDYH